LIGKNKTKKFGSLPVFIIEDSTRASCHNKQVRQDAASAIHRLGVQSKKD